MKEKAALKLIELATQLACATMSADRKTASQKSSIPKGAESVLEDCLQAVQAHFHDMTKPG